MKSSKHQINKKKISSSMKLSFKSRSQSSSPLHSSFSESESISENTQPQKERSPEINKEESKQSLQQSAYSLTSEITTCIPEILDFQEYESLSHQFSMNQFQSPTVLSQQEKMKLYKHQETLYDKLYETIARIENILQYSKKIDHLIHSFKYLFHTFITSCKMKREQCGNQMNDLLTMMKEIEISKETDENESYIQTELFKNTEEMKKMKEEIEKTTRATEQMTIELNQRRKRYDELKNPKVSFLEFEQLEKWTSKCFGEIIFDSKKHCWKEEKSVFNEKIIGKKQLLFLIEEEDVLDII